MSMDDNDGQMIFGDLGGRKFPDICLTGEEKPRKYLTQETSPDRGSNPGPLRDKRAKTMKFRIYMYICVCARARVRVCVCVCVCVVLPTIPDDC